jgi:hypothetical protein
MPQIFTEKKQSVLTREICVKNGSQKPQIFAEKQSMLIHEICEKK